LLKSYQVCVDPDCTNYCAQLVCLNVAAL
jgi:hypothetical protein